MIKAWSWGDVELHLSELDSIWTWRWKSLKLNWKLSFSMLFLFLMPFYHLFFSFCNHCKGIKIFWLPTYTKSKIDIGTMFVRIKHLAKLMRLSWYVSHIGTQEDSLKGLLCPIHTEEPFMVQLIKMRTRLRSHSLFYDSVIVHCYPTCHERCLQKAHFDFHERCLPQAL